MGAIKEYKKALDILDRSGKSSEEQDVGLSHEVTRALDLLQDDIQAKIRELESLVEVQRPEESKNSSTVGSLWNASSMSNQTVVKTRTLEGSLNGTMGLMMDPLLVSLINKLQVNFINAVSEELKRTESHDIQSIESQVKQQIGRFKKELGMYEQKKIKEYNLRLDQAIKENKKLSNQIVKLRERWDSLVESAKQRRNKKQDD